MNRTELEAALKKEASDAYKRGLDKLFSGEVQHMHMFETDRLILRSVTADELDTIYHIMVKEIEGPTFSRQDFDSELNFDLHFARQPLGRHFGRPGLYLKTTNRYIGYCTFMPRLWTAEDQGVYILRGDQLQHTSIEAEVGWAIAEPHRNHGYATEAARMLIEYGLDELGLPRALAFTERTNVASLRVMEKLNMRVEHAADTDAVIGVTEHGAL